MLFQVHSKRSTDVVVGRHELARPSDDAGSWRPSIRVASVVGATLPMMDAANRFEVVSRDDELLILVDDDDRQIGTLDKSSCHDGEGTLHRAFSLFVFNPEGETLLQRRHTDKRLWPGYWSNGCCSHPRVGEELGARWFAVPSRSLGLPSLQNSCSSSSTARRFEMSAPSSSCVPSLSATASAHLGSTRPRLPTGDGSRPRHWTGRSPHRHSASHLGCRWSGGGCARSFPGACGAVDDHRTRRGFATRGVGTSHGY